MIRAPVLLAVMALAFLAAAGPAHAQDEPPTVVPIVLRPSPAPVPALKYRILPERTYTGPRQCRHLLPPCGRVDPGGSGSAFVNACQREEPTGRHG